MVIFSGISLMIGSVHAEPRRFTTMGTLRPEVILRLRQDIRVLNPFETPDDPDSVTFSLANDSVSSGKVLLNLGNLLGNLNRMNAEEERDEIDRFLASVIAMIVDKSQFDPRSVYLNIRPRSYLTSMWHGGTSANEDNPLLFRELPGDIIEVYSAKKPRGLSLVMKADLGDWSRELVEEAATRNLAALLPDLVDTLKLYAAPPRSRDSLLVSSRFQIRDNVDLTAGLLLLDAFWNQLDRLYPDGVIVAIPQRSTILAVSRTLPNPVETIRSLIAQEQQEDPAYLLSDSVYEQRGGKLSVVAE